MEMDGDRMDLNEGVPSEQEISRVSEMDQGNYIHVYNDLIKEEIDVYDVIKEEIDVYDDIGEEFHADDDIKEEIVYDDIKEIDVHDVIEEEIDVYDVIEEEIDVYDDVYHSPEMINNAKDKMSNCSPGDGPGAGSPEWSLSRVAAVCLGLLCVLLLAGIIGLGLHYSVERSQLQSSNNDLTRERDQLQTSNQDLTRERDQLETSNQDLTRERDQLQSSYNTLKEREDLQKRLCEKTHCEDGWTRFGSSCYYVSTEQKTWDESRHDCIRRGTDLVIVNNREEQVFLSSLIKPVWIGLTDRDVEGIWTWVDGTPLTTAYWYPGGKYTRQPDNGEGKKEEDCAAISPNFDDSVNKWHDWPCGSFGSFGHVVCERGI